MVGSLPLASLCTGVTMIMTKPWSWFSGRQIWSPSSNHPCRLGDCDGEIILRVASISILSRDPNLRKPPTKNPTKKDPVFEKNDG